MELQTRKTGKFIEMAEKQVVGEKLGPFSFNFTRIKCLHLLSNMFILLYM